MSPIDPDLTVYGGFDFYSSAVLKVQIADFIID